jgi:hypothetical protein
MSSCLCLMHSNLTPKLLKQPTTMCGDKIDNEISEDKSYTLVKSNTNI